MKLKIRDTEAAPIEPEVTLWLQKGCGKGSIVVKCIGPDGGEWNLIEFSPDGTVRCFGGCEQTGFKTTYNGHLSVEDY